MEQALKARQRRFFASIARSGGFGTYYGRHLALARFYDNDACEVAYSYRKYEYIPTFRRLAAAHRQMAEYWDYKLLKQETK